MSRYVTVEVDTTVDVDLADINDADLLAELRDRNHAVPPELEEGKRVVEQAFEAYRRNDMRRLDDALREIFDRVLGRVAGDSPLRVSP